MFSNDLERHAPSWPCAQVQRTRRSASLHNTIWSRRQAVLASTVAEIRTLLS